MQMSDEDIWAIQGLAHKALRVAKSNAATLTAGLLETGKDLIDLGNLLRQFARDPKLRSSSGISPVEHLKNGLGAVVTARTLEMIDEFAAQAARAYELQKQVDQF